MIDPDALNLWHDLQVVGYLQQDALGRISFVYDQDWLNTGFQISCSLPLQSAEFTAEEGRAHRFFANLLPEAGAREQIIRDLKITDTDFNLLRAIGGECAGALSILETQYVPSRSVSYCPLDDAGLKKILLGKGRPLSLKIKEHTRLSLAGAQNKCPVLVNEGGYWLPQNESPSNAILKFELSDYRHLPAYETFTTLLARRLGLPVVDIQLKQYEDIYFAEVKRYDRYVSAQGEVVRMHQEDLCQALGYGHNKKYQEEGGPGFVDCFHLIKAKSSQPLVDLPNLLRWLIFNVLAGNSDGHAKNLSLLYAKEGLCLAPFYDLISTRAIERVDYHLAMSIGKERNPSLIWQEHWRELAKQCELPDTLVFKQVTTMAKTLLDIVSICKKEFQQLYGDYPALIHIEQLVRKQCGRILSGFVPSGSSQNIVIIRVSYPGVRSRTRYYNGSSQMTESHVHLP